MATENPQRAYRAPCPGCGAPVEFRSAQSTYAVCAFCQTTVVRDGETLSRIGKMAELFDDFSPLQLQAAGVYDGRNFTLVGRLQYRYAQGTWTEWYAVFDDGSPGFLSEDNGAYVFSLPTALERELPAPESFRVGATTAINAKTFSVASNASVSLISAQGELPHLPPVGKPFAMVELRSVEGEVLGVDYGTAPAALSLGRAVMLEDLKLTGLKDESAKQANGRQFNCPNCGAPVDVRLAASKSITCSSCKSIIDLTQGTGGELKHALQRDPVNLLIPLGSTGNLQGVKWQVVGFQHRMGHEPDDPDEAFGWDEYLLFNKKRGFIFLVDSEEGWSIVKPVTGAPAYKTGGQNATYLKTSYRLESSYSAETTYAAGEFYWQVESGQKTFNRDFANGSSLLSQEETPNEITWSSGSKIDSSLVAKAFQLEGKQAMFKRDDAKPLSSGSGMGCASIIIVVVLIVLFLFAFGRCTSCNPNLENCSSSSSSRSSGGSYGGSSSGGSHK